MRILLLDGAPEFGGQARHVYDLALGLQGRGHDVTVSCNHKKLYHALQTADVAVLPATFRHGPDVPTMLQLSRAIREMKADVVHTHGVRAGVIGRLSAKAAWTPRIIHTVHTMSEDLVRGRGPIGELGRISYAQADKWLSRWTDIIVAISADVHRRTLAEGIPKQKVVTIHSGLDVSRYGLLDKNAARNKLGIPNGCRVIGTVARFTRQKNLGDLIRAARAVIKDLPDSILVLVGDGEELVEMKRLAQDLGIGHKVIFTGYRNDISDILPAFDVFAMSSLWEGCPLAPLEAMASGLPVVAPDVTGVAETVADGITGYVVPPSDPDALAAAIVRTLQSGRAVSMGAAAKERVANFFGLDRMVHQIERVYLKQAEFTPSRLVAQASK